MNTPEIIRANLRALLSRDPTDREVMDHACVLLEQACLEIEHMRPAYSEAMRRGMRGKHAPVAGSNRGDVDPEHDKA